MDAALQNLVNAVRRRAPNPVDEWEATAWVESFGWTDERIRAAFGLPDTRTLGRQIYRRAAATPRRTSHTPGALKQQDSLLSTVATTYSRTLVYALPWLVTFAIEGFWPDVFNTEPAMAGPISVAVMASLIVSGGFVQAIARKGSFYLGMQQLIMARHLGWLLYRTGLISAVAVAGVALVAGSYFGAFESFVARIVALSYFVMLNALWLACALLSMRTPAWWVPAVYVCAGAVFVVARSQFEASALVAQTAAVVAALAAANALAWDAFRAAARHDSRTETIVLPRLPVLLQSLLPFFVYGVAYFAFLFADRLSAGSALPVQSGLTFGIAVDYKRGIDLAFLVFLVVAGAVECCTVLLMRFWRHTAERSANVADLRVELLRRRRKGHLAIIVVSATCAAIAASAAWRVGFLTNPGYVVFAAGSIGYSLFAAGLFDALTLFSVNRPAVVLRALLPALALNLVTGYALSHIVAAEFAVAGLVVGAAVFMLDARRGVHDALRRPDYAYSWA